MTPWPMGPLGEAHGPLLGPPMGPPLALGGVAPWGAHGAPGVKSHWQVLDLHEPPMDPQGPLDPQDPIGAQGHMGPQRSLTLSTARTRSTSMLGQDLLMPSHRSSRVGNIAYTT